MFRARGFIFRKAAVYTVTVRYCTFYTHHYKQPSTYKTAYSSVCKTYRTVTVRIAAFLKMNPRVRNM